MIIHFGKYLGYSVNVIFMLDNAYYLWAASQKIEPFWNKEENCPRIAGRRQSDRTMISENSFSDHTDHYYEDMIGGGCC